MDRGQVQGLGVGAMPLSSPPLGHDAEPSDVGAMQLTSPPLGHDAKPSEGSGTQVYARGLGNGLFTMWMHFCSKSQESHSDKGTLPIEGHSQSRTLGDWGEPGR